MTFNGSAATPQQKKISQATVRAQEQERSLIAAELHDNVNQLVLTAKLHIGMARQDLGCSASALRKAEEYLVQAIEGIKQVTHRLSGALIIHEGLGKLVTEITDAMTMLGITVQEDIAHSLLAKLLPEQQLMVYRIIQEQTSNILKYSGTTEALLSLQDEAGMAVLVVSDKGKGFDKETVKPGGIGFINIYNRAAAFGGTVEITTAPGNGCTLKVIFPVTPPTDK